MAVGILGEFPVAVELAEDAERRRRRFAGKRRGVAEIARHRPALAFERADPRIEHFDRRRVGAHVAAQRRQLGLGLGQFVAQPCGERGIGRGGLLRIGETGAFAEPAERFQRAVEPPPRRGNLVLGAPLGVAAQPQRQIVDQRLAGPGGRLGDAQRILRGERAHPHDDAGPVRIVKGLDLPLPEADERLDRRRQGEARGPIGRRRREDAAQIERGADRVDRGAAVQVGDDDPGIGGDPGCAAAEPGGLGRGGLGAPQGETELGDILVGGDGELVDRRGDDGNGDGDGEAEPAPAGAPRGPGGRRRAGQADDLGARPGAAQAQHRCASAGMAR